MIKGNTREDSAFDLTESQRAILTGQYMQAGQAHYNMCMCFSIEGCLDVSAFQQAFTKLIEHCDALRTVIIESPEKLASQAKQVVLKEIDFTLPVHDFSSLENPLAESSAWVAHNKVKLFDLQQHLFATAILKLSEKHFIWYLNQHHIVTDAWSMSVLYQKMQSFYKALLNSDQTTFSDLPSFKAYTEFEREQKESKRFARAAGYWQKCAKSPNQSSRFYRSAPKDKTAKTDRVQCQFGFKRSTKIREIAGAQFQSLSEDLSIMQIFSTLLFSLLYRLNNDTHLAIGTPTHSRSSTKLRDTAGLLINVFPLQVDIGEQETFRTLYDKVAKANQNLLVNAMPGAGDMKLARKFDVVLNYIPSAFGSFCSMPATTDWVHSGYGDRDHVVRMQVHDFNQTGEFSVYFDLNEDLFSVDERAWLCEHFLILADAFLDSPTTQISKPPLQDLCLLPYQNSVDKISSDGFVDILALLNEQAQATPSDIALLANSQAITYRQLHKQSNQFAKFLDSKNIDKGDVVALKLDRSIEAVIVILGILKAGASFLPFDISHPTKRNLYMLADSAASLLIVDNSTFSEDFDSNTTINLSQSWPSILQMSPNIAPVKIDKEDIAYLIYTSGSSGQPKGVLVKHQGLSNYIQWAKTYYLDGQVLDFALFSSLSFDLTITSLFVPLISGGRLVVYPHEGIDSGIAIRNVVEDNRVDVIKLTPSHLSLIEAMDFSESRLKKLIVGGEDFKATLAHNIHRYFSGEIEQFNEYGPTEATVACTVHKFDPECDISSSVPIGRPIANANVFILDSYLNLVPQGGIGEIYIAGVGLAQGYINQKEQTDIAFIAHPFAKNERLYRTGDTALYNHNGDIEYIGRKDEQLKVNGVRVEAAEIESCLLQFDGISAAIVDLSQHIIQQNDEHESLHCKVCGIEANHPSAQIDVSGTCRICRIYEQQEAQAQSYFRTHEDLKAKIAKIKQKASNKQDSIMLLSGGKDSSFALCKLVDMGLTPLVFTLDNGYISEGAKANMTRLVERLGLELYIAKTDAMNDIFVDSLNRFSNVCNGCFKTIYTMSMKLAKERGIKVICTGLSRGQIFETRVAHLFQQGCFDAQEIDKRIVEARRAYHRTRDIVANRLDVSVFDDDGIFEEIEYLDFYRYEDVSLDTIYAYLNDIAPWIRPSDTGRSTNCLINDAGIYVHKRERGYHNYSLPYSWDVRLGHKKRDAALDELDDELDMQKVDEILTQIGYQSEDIYTGKVQQERLIAYYVSSSEILKNTLQKHLAMRLPKEYIPTQFVWMAHLPVTANGKVDRKSLPRPRENRRELVIDYVAPRNTKERVFASLWQKLLGVEEVGIDDNFFDLGGDSIVNMQIVAAARESQIVINPQQIFDYPTIRALALVAIIDETILNNASETNPQTALDTQSTGVSQQDFDDIFNEFGED